MGFGALKLVSCSQSVSVLVLQHICLNDLTLSFPAYVAEQGSSPVAFPPLRSLGKAECRLEKFLVYSIDKVLLF